MKVYILLLVTYDYHRFQDNIFVGSSIEECEKVAKDENSYNNCYCYNDNHHNELDQNETSHYCIQEFIINQIPAIINE